MANGEDIASVGGVVGHADSGYYVATKFVVEGLSEALAQEVVTIRGFESVKLCEDAVQRR